MSSISITFDARQLKSEVREYVNRKLPSLKANHELYVRILELFYTYVIAYLPEDTGALKMVGEGYAKNGYFRTFHGNIGKGHHGLEFDAVEERPKGDRHYAGVVFSKIFGGTASSDIVDMMMSDGSWDEFVEEAKDIIVEYMNNEQK